MTNPVSIPLQFTNSEGYLTPVARQVMYKITELFNAEKAGVLPQSFSISIPGATLYGIVFISGEGLAQTTGALADGELIIGVSGSAPVSGSLDGTPNRIDIASGSGSIQVDISAGYQGQSSITTLGTVTAGTWNASPVGAGYGGTGITTYTAGDIIYATGTTALAKLAAAAAGNVLLSGASPSWGKVGLATHISGTLAAGNGGTGLATYAVGDIVYASGTTTLSRLADVATGSALVSGGVGVAPAWSTSLALTNGFGCNGKAAQTSASVNSAIGATAGATYTAAEQTMINDLKALTNQLRSLLIANGQAV